MVPKVAVIALVGILAVPILLGYALNLDQVTETDYKVSGDPVNVTQLLQTGTNYTYAHADIHQLNSNFTNYFYQKTIPHYVITDTKSSYEMYTFDYIGWHPGWNGPLSIWSYRYYETDYSGTGGYVVGNYTDPNGATIQTIPRLHSFYYDSSAGTITYTYYRYAGSYELSSGSITVTDTQNRFALTDTGNYQSNGWAAYVNSNDAYGYVDFSQGYYFDLPYYPNAPYAGETYYTVDAKLPNYSRSALLTIDLSSITDANYRTTIDTYTILEKTTTDGVVKWQLKQRPMVQDGTLETTDLYYDQTTNNNTYQIKIWAEQEGYPAGNGLYNTAYTRHYDCHYVGAWPETIGEANYYQLISATTKTASNAVNIKIGGFSDHSPTVRVDDAEFRAMEYQVISDKTYSPADFKQNPTTTIDNITTYGTSINFGGNAYLVKNGNITMGTHQVPVKGLVLSSVPNGSGGYDNKIGETIISTTAEPSTITFNGKWSASITTTAQEQYEYTKTEWVAGEFAWDGVDQNFLMVGLLTSLGAFIALGIYARRSKASIWPLLVVCGGAALLFFVML